MCLIYENIGGGAAADVQIWLELDDRRCLNMLVGLV